MNIVSIVVFFLMIRGMFATISDLKNIIFGKEESHGSNEEKTF